MHLVNRRASQIFRSLITTGALLNAGTAIAEQSPGDTATMIKIGNTAPYSGPASSVSSLAKSEAAVFRMVNDRGGVGGRKIEFISLDDAYSAPKTVEQTRRLVESDDVALIFGSVGTATSASVQRYLNQKQIPQLFISSGATRWGDQKQFPWSMGFQPTYKLEGLIFGRYIRKANPRGGVGVIFQNDDLGREYLAGIKEGLGTDSKVPIVEKAYDITAPTLDSEVVGMRSAGVEFLVVVGLPRSNAQMIRKVSEIGWKPQLFVSSVGSQVGSVMKPAGGEKAIGAISAYWIKDPNDSAWANDAGMKEWRSFMAKYLPQADTADGGYVAGYSQALLLVHVLEQCGADFSRENIMKQATHIKGVVLPTLFPGITINTESSQPYPITQMQPVRWDGESWKPFGPIASQDEQ